MKSTIIQIRILLEITFWIIALYGYDNLRNSWQWFFRNFIIVITSVTESILELFSTFRALCKSMHAFSCIVEIAIATAIPTML